MESCFSTAGNLYTGEVALSLGDHSEKTAWYTSLTGGRSNYGLATPVVSVLHDATNSGSGFFSLIHNQTPRDQLRLDAQYRQDFFQVPYDPDPNDYECASGYYCSTDLRDVQTERDSFVIANWVHTISPKALFSVAPFYHFNLADYDSLASDMPVATTWHQTSNYVGGQADVPSRARPKQLLRRALLLLSEGKRSLRRRIRTANASPRRLLVIRLEMPTPGWSSFTWPTTFAWAGM